MKIKKLIILTHIFFSVIIFIFLIRAIFFENSWVWVFLNLAIWLNVWNSLEIIKEKRKRK